MRKTSNQERKKCSEQQGRGQHVRKQDEHKSLTVSNRINDQIALCLMDASDSC